MHRFALVAAAGLSLIAAPAHALDPSYALMQYQHTVWTERDGAPTNVRGLAQSPDGYLWIASPTGLTRFDGFEFEPVTSLGGESLAQDTVSGLFNGPDGSIVLKFGSGRGAAVYASGHLIRLPSCDLAPGSAKVGGETWLICNGQPMRLTRSGIESVGGGWNYPAIASTSLTSDGHGNVWVTANGRVATSTWPSRAFSWRTRSGDTAIVAAHDGTLWSADEHGIVMLRRQEDAPIGDLRVWQRATTQLLFDRNGSLWAGGPDGLFHEGDLRKLTSHPGTAPVAPDTMNRVGGMSSDVVTALFEDSRGSIWVGTPAGLERFKDNLAFPIRLTGQLLPPSIAPDGSGGVWAATFTGKLLRASVDTLRFHGDLGAGAITCLARAPDGVIWLATERRGLFRIMDGQILHATDIPSDVLGGAITAISFDSDGSIWTGSAINGVVGHFAAGNWSVARADRGLPSHWGSRTVLIDHDGRLWASRHDDLILLQQGRTTRFSAAQGLSVGEIFTLQKQGARLWVGGRGGVAYFDGAAFHTLKSAREHAFSEVGALVMTREGDLWIDEYDAAVRVSAAELDKQRRDPLYQVQSDRFDSLDGLYGRSPVPAARPSMVQADDGRLWFSTSEGLMVVDPGKIHPVNYVPPVRVQSIHVDGVARDLVAPLRLRRDAKVVRFVYSAISPDGAERVKFRYRLDGLDADWTEAGTRRAITYNTLPPGKYRFRVEATDDGGQWVANATTIDFAVEAAWFETLAFRLIYGGAALFGIWSIYRWHLAWMTGKVRWKLKVQQAERERIARDLHDTLLQGVQGLTWRLQGIANLMPQTDPVRSKLEGALNVTDSLLIESRHRVLAVRQRGGTPFPLVEAIEDVVAGAVEFRPVAFSCEVVGKEIPVKDHVQVDVCDIVREAFVNAVTHGGATSIEIRIEYGRRGLTVVIRDDGSGIDPVIAKEGRPGHWGLTGMRERARELGGILSITALDGRGTEVRFRLGARKAFDPDGGPTP